MFETDSKYLRLSEGNIISIFFVLIGVKGRVLYGLQIIVVLSTCKCPHFVKKGILDGTYSPFFTIEQLDHHRQHLNQVFEIHDLLATTEKSRINVR